MDNLFSLLGYSIKAVGTIFLVAGSGTILVRFNFLKTESLRVLSQLVFSLMLPCLLFIKVAETIELKLLKDWYVLPLSCVVYICAGIGLGLLMKKLIRIPKDFANCAVASCGFANSGFIPIPLTMAVCAIFPAFSANPKAGAIGVSMISVYLLGFSPLYWSLGYSLVAGHKMHEIRLKHVLTPPIIGMLAGVIVGLVPVLRSTFCEKEGLLFPVFNAVDIIGNGAIPCALIVLGGKLANGPVKGAVSLKTVLMIIGIKLLILPILALAYVKLLRISQVIPMTPLFSLLLVLEAASPSGVNLVLMCSLFKNGQEERMATLLFWVYLASVPTLIIFIMLSLWLFP